VGAVIKATTSGDSYRMELIAVPARLPAADARERLAELFENHVDFVWRTAHRFGLSAAEADDAAQQVFLIASRKLEQIGPDREKAFLFRVAIHVTRTLLRSTARKREDFVEEPDTADQKPSPEQALETRRALDTAHRILQEMPDDLREAFILFELEEMTMREVADLLEIPPGTVASRIRRARAIFRAAVQAVEAT
jgi:RNA polymerase sigma-70 factor (ECF subfamily)